jgi:hypothetical protein
MADLSITAANVVAGSDAVRESGTAGATITAGQAVYLDTTDMKYKLADSNGAAALRVPNGIALHGAANNQPIVLQKDGDLTIGATMVAGVAYYLSDTPGGICPVADLASGEYPCIVGIAKSTSVLSVHIQPSGVSL